MKNKQFRILNCMPLLLIGFAIMSASPLAAQDQLVLPVQHDHAWGSCSGTLTLGDRGVRYETAHLKDARNWAYDDVQQIQIEEGRRLKLLTYEDRRWRFGADKVFEFAWLGSGTTPEEVYRFLEPRVRRPIAAWLSPNEIGDVQHEFPVKHLGVLSGHEGRLLFTDRWIVLQSVAGKDETGSDRTWRYQDIENISSSDPYELTLTTHERQRFQYASRRVYRFQLKQRLLPETYDALWRFVNAKIAER